MRKVVVVGKGVVGGRGGGMRKMFGSGGSSEKGVRKWEKEFKLGME